MKKIITINIVTILLILIIGAVAFYFYNQSANYIKTDNAKVDSEQMKLSSPIPGQITKLNAKEGDKLNEGDTVAEVTGKGQDGQPQKMEIKMPKDGTIAKMDGQENGMAQAGQPMAYAYNMNDLYITANIDETDVKDLSENEKVDVSIDGQSSQIKGRVDRIGNATASSFSLMPSSNSDGNYTKVTQVVPVKIKLDNQPSKGIVPGMNAEVSIHKN
ncbi:MULTISPECIES: HlyD family efflux transporter periplasmic adaptor subunit [Staphylococcus]|uniref:HlyD family efflux transporter periplasmic adaptor subunit n=1 Tax=Staphylococcus chromogenes TaxID=46126 RepID=A0AAE5T2G7_STACR|nr:MULTISPECIES: HlyD family efflux transporter periplasmic adaptor subunit [Staphylococcus]KDP13994.1 Multidrug resistance protein [Staphylococcus chromogenes MU 970]MBP0046805.1 HlyD family secretion protein [Staphylococcus chromogenes]MBV5138034.1 HlyD family efflux transporter periplasmic adaptor subunit [Staphylococcus chromogenes]MBV5192107.1 HlyD family efflux transporter periplasmic adaptor subunit [Staphylococcus chromogenes]MBW3132934.1 HlyD family efflux transporter periplasmic adap